MYIYALSAHEYSMQVSFRLQMRRWKLLTGLAAIIVTTSTIADAIECNPTTFHCHVNTYHIENPKQWAFFS